MTRIATTLILLALGGCSSLSVRAPICEPPPIPATVMQACEEPELLTEGQMRDLYLQMLRDAGPWGRCIRNHDKLIEMVKYRDSICTKFRQDNQTKSGWRWPWE